MPRVFPSYLQYISSISAEQSRAQHRATGLPPRNCPPLSLIYPPPSSPSRVGNLFSQLTFPAPSIHTLSDYSYSKWASFFFRLCNLFPISHSSCNAILCSNKVSPNPGLPPSFMEDCRRERRKSVTKIRKDPKTFAYLGL